MAVVQAMHGHLTHRHRRQASSHIYFVVYPTDKPKQLVFCGERACPALGCKAAPKPAAAVYLVQRIRLIGAASQPSAGDAAFRQARSPQLRYLPGSRRCGKVV